MARKYVKQHGHTYPYYKVQYYDDISLCWRDVQKVSYETEEAARKSFLPGKRCRVMCVTENKRYPLEEQR